MPAGKAVSEGFSLSSGSPEKHHFDRTAGKILTISPLGLPPVQNSLSSLQHSGTSQAVLCCHFGNYIL